jgi:CRISPR-associated protein (TIGR02710 family)
MIAPVQTVLIVTVGGSHQPIVTAIRELAPDYVCFICTSRDSGTGKPGSDIQVTGKGMVIKAKPSDERPTLPNIPQQLQLQADTFEHEVVAADDLDNAFGVISATITHLRQRFPSARLVADYTGGTKSMSAGMVMAALEEDAVELHLVTGNRADLVKVSDGTQYSAIAISDGIRLHRATAPYLAGWKRFAYDEAAAGLESISPPKDNLLRGRMFRARDLSRAFAAWDRFDHDEARRHLDNYAPVVARDLQQHINTLRCLTGNSPRKEPMQLFDLWRNAERRAAQGRYDDAVARVYRLLEWSAQWLLKSCCGIDSSEVPPDRIPAGMFLSPGRDGKIQVALFAAWEMVGALTNGPAAEFFRSQRTTLLSHLQMRNHSILAHGFTPINKAEWLDFSGWCQKTLLPVMLEESGNKELPPQLPQAFLWES